jgi:NADPH:quinone reductase-like Zn-dependent oxidoreductase
VLRPGEITHEEASSALIGGLRAYTGLHYKAKIVAGDTVLIFNGSVKA